MARRKSARRSPSKAPTEDAPPEAAADEAPSEAPAEEALPEAAIEKAPPSPKKAKRSAVLSTAAMAAIVAARDADADEAPAYIPVPGVSRWQWHAVSAYGWIDHTPEAAAALQARRRMPFFSRPPDDVSLQCQSV